MSMEIKKETIYNYFDNKATTLEKRRIEEWVKDPQNRELFYEYLAEWESLNIQYVSDVDAALRRHRRRFETIETQIEIDSNETNASKFSFRKFAIAASFFLAAL